MKEKANLKELKIFGFCKKKCDFDFNIFLTRILKATKGVGGYLLGDQRSSCASPTPCGSSPLQTIAPWPGLKARNMKNKKQSNVKGEMKRYLYICTYIFIIYIYILYIHSFEHDDLDIILILFKILF